MSSGDDSAAPPKEKESENSTERQEEEELPAQVRFAFLRSVGILVVHPFLCFACASLCYMLHC